MPIQLRMKMFKFNLLEELNLATSQNGLIMTVALITTAQLTISTMVRPLHTLWSEKMFNWSLNMNQSGPITQETLTKMVQLIIFITAKPALTVY